MPRALAQFEHQDWLGTERVQSDVNGNNAGTSLSLPFGDGFSTTDGCGNDAYHFAGYDQDNSANEHAQFREYSNMAGRWFSPDPYQGSYDPNNPQSFNRYAYVLNNPLSFTDPLGLATVICYTYPDTNDPAYNRSGTTIGVIAGYTYCESVGDGGGGGGAAGGGGGGGGTGTAPNNGLLDKLRKAYCSAVPTGRSESVSGALGGIGAVSGEGDMVLNYNSGQTSLFATGGMSFGWNGGASVTATSGLVYGLDGTNNGFSGPFKGASFYAPTPIPFVGAGGSVVHSGGVTVVSAGASAALVGRYGFGVSVTNTTNPLNIGRFTGFSLGDFIGYLARRPCN